jgi:hypothetical protein
MTGSVYPCEKCGEQNWVMDIDDNGLCADCAREKPEVVELDGVS